MLNKTYYNDPLFEKALENVMKKYKLFWVRTIY